MFVKEMEKLKIDMGYKLAYFDKTEIEITWKTRQFINSKYKRTDRKSVV